MTPHEYQARLQALLAKRGIHVAPQSMASPYGLVGGITPGLILSIDLDPGGVYAQILTTDPGDMPLEQVGFVEDTAPKYVCQQIAQLCRPYRKAKP